MYKAKITYKAGIDGTMTVDEQVQKCDYLARTNGGNKSRNFEESLRYEVTSTVVNILSNATLKYAGSTNELTNTLQENLIDIFFMLYKNGVCYLQITGMQITGISEKQGNILLIDKTHELTGTTQRSAVNRYLDMYGLICDVKYSVIDERGVLGIFSPKKDVVVKPTQASEIYDKFLNLFGAKRKQRKFAFFEVGMDYQGVTLPIAEMQLLENEKQSIGNVARVLGIQEDMILRGGTYDNKDNAIAQTYVNYKGWIYGIIQQIEKQLISFRNAEFYEVTFTGVPQLQKTDEQ